MNLIPEFDHFAEYARFWDTSSDTLRNKKHPYTWKVEIMPVSDSTELISLTSQYRGRVRGFVYNYTLSVEWSNGQKKYTPRHLISADAIVKLLAMTSRESGGTLIQIFSLLAHCLTHDVLHGLNGVPEDFAEFDTELMFWGIEFFAIMSHSEIFLEWMERGSNKEFVLTLQRMYLSLLQPIAREHERNNDPELLKLLDYFVIIYLKCLLTLIPYNNEVVAKFGGRAQKDLYCDLPMVTITRSRMEALLEKGLQKSSLKNNITLTKKPDFNRGTTGAAKYWLEFIAAYFANWEQSIEVPYVMKLMIENLVWSSCIRLVPAMPRNSAILRTQFQKFFTKR